MVNFNVQKFREPILAPGFYLPDGTNLAEAGGGAEASDTASTPASGVTLEDAPAAVQRIRLTLDNVIFRLPGTTDFDTLEIADLGAARTLYILGIASDLTLVKSGGAGTGTSIDIGLGSTAATSINISGTAENIGRKFDVPVSGTLTDTARMRSFPTLSANNVQQYPRLAAGSTMYLNVGASVAADATITISGTIDIWYLDLTFSV